MGYRSSQQAQQRRTGIDGFLCSKDATFLLQMTLLKSPMKVHSYGTSSLSLDGCTILQDSLQYSTIVRFISALYQLTMYLLNASNPIEAIRLCHLSLSLC